MALTITSGPEDWSISETNGKDTANFQWEGHPDFHEGKEYYIYYVAKLNGQWVDHEGNNIAEHLSSDAGIKTLCTVNHCVYIPEAEGSIHMDGEQLGHLFTEGNWTVQMFFCRNNEYRILTDSDRAYLDSGDLPPDWIGEEILEASNIWSWEVTA